MEECNLNFYSLGELSLRHIRTESEDNFKQIFCPAEMGSAREVGNVKVVAP